MQATQLKDAGCEKTGELERYEITIEANPDRWRGGFAWSVSLGDEEVRCGLEFSRRLAQQNAHKCVTNLRSTN